MPNAIPPRLFSTRRDDAVVLEEYVQEEQRRDGQTWRYPEGLRPQSSIAALRLLDVPQGYDFVGKPCAREIDFRNALEDYV